jgi:hypothetical protein
VKGETLTMMIYSESIKNSQACLTSESNLLRTGGGSPKLQLSAGSGASRGQRSKAKKAEDDAELGRPVAEAKGDHCGEAE